MITRLTASVVLLTLTACGRSEPPDGSWLEEPVALDTPAPAGSRYPHLATLESGALISWLEPGAKGDFLLRAATLREGSWSAPRTVATGADWFINWADFPSVIAVTDRLWAAHWLQQKPGDVYSYDVRLSVSPDAGATWSPPMSPHDDGTPTEHGFVSLLASGGRVQAAWLDGRHTTGEHEHDHGTGGPMTLRGAMVQPDGRLQDRDYELDGRVCDCCQTDAAMTSEGAVVVYRDRSDDEIRDIAIVRLTADGGSQPVLVSGDGWRIEACPVNGPAVDARGNDVVVAWFTAPDKPRVRVAFSGDGGRTFSKAVEVASGKVAGRVDVVLLPDGRAAVSWLADAPGAAEVRVQRFARDGAAGAATTITRSDVARSSGFPQMVLVDSGLLFAWTESGAVPRVQTALAGLR